MARHHITTENSPTGHEIEGARRHPTDDVQGLARMQAHQATRAQVAADADIRHGIHREAPPTVTSPPSPTEPLAAGRVLPLTVTAPASRVTGHGQIQVTMDLDIAPTVAQHQRAGVDLRFAGRHPAARRTWSALTLARPPTVSGARISTVSAADRLAAPVTELAAFTLTRPPAWTDRSPPLAVAPSMFRLPAASRVMD
jgi:hypothetical protein